MQDWRNGGFGIYVHWPYCEAKCPYCDFNSYVSRSIDHDAWRRAYVSELTRYASETPGRLVNSVFFGGGTPSLMEPRTVEAVLNCIAKNWPIANDLEVTLEANPSSVEADKFAAFRAAGVNRVSLGVQALNDTDLRRLGRLHNVKEALRALEIARSCFDRASFDLIYARQNQSLKDWESELKQALTMGFLHFSLYQLTIEDDTAFGERYKRGTLTGLPNDDLSADMYTLTHALCEDAGLPYYEVSNFAAPGEESRHNLIYWTYGDYLGIGPGAHSRITLGENTRLAVETKLNPMGWLMSALAGGGESARVELTASEQADELLVMNMRLRRGMEVRRYETLSGRNISHQTLRSLAQDGFIEQNGTTIHVHRDHVALTNTIIEALSRD
jgi:oxygen-independent coproporphyrinogen-3 oxidase